MLKRNVFSGLGLVLLAALVVALLPTATRAQPETGTENFFLINYIGQELYLDLDDVQYIVPGTATAPQGGRLALRLDPGEHKYAANVPGVPTGSAGEFTLVPGGVVGKAARIEQTRPLVRNGILLEGPEDYVFLFDFDPRAAPVAETPVADTWQPAPASAGVGSLVWINYSGADELTVDLAGQLYKVPPQANGIPGRLQIEVDPAFYRYTASVPNGSLNGEITVVAGQVIGLNMIPGIRQEPEYDVGDKFEFITAVDLKLFQEDLTGRAIAGQPETAPAALPTTGGEIVPKALPALTGEEGLLVKNFAGDALTFTINNQAYTIADNAEALLPLPPGQYNYTASLPFVATTGTIDRLDGQQIELSIVINVARDFLTVYRK